MTIRKIAIGLGVAFLISAGAGAAAQRTISGADEALCAPGRPAVMITVRGFKNDVGIVRVQLYAGDAATFLKKGDWLLRAERRRDGKPQMRFCLPVPRPGTYGIAARHDANGNGKSDWNDGGGFSRNPALSLLEPKPKLAEVAIEVGNDARPVDIVMQYRTGLSIKPAR